MPRTSENSHDPAGVHQRTCPECGIIFRTDNERIVYCSQQCRKRAKNRRNYERHREQRIVKVIERRKR